MKSNEFIKLFEAHPIVLQLKQFMSEQNSHIVASGMSGSIKAITTAIISQLDSAPSIVILGDKEEAAYFRDDLRTLLTPEQVLFFPSSYKRSIQYNKIDNDSIVLRTEVLNRLRKKNRRKYSPIIVTYPEALIEKVISGKGLDSNTLHISKGEKVSLDFINEVLIEYGFERVDFVYEPGQFSIRGSIIDIFSFSNEDPYRVDFFGEEVDSIRSFDVENQISRAPFESISIIPDIQQGLEDEKHISFFEFLPDNVLTIFSDSGFIFNRIDEIYNATKEQMTIEQGEDGIVLANSIMVQGNIQAEQAEKFQRIDLSGKTIFNDTVEKVEFSTSPQPVFNKNFELLAEHLIENKAKEYTNLILSNNLKQIDRLNDIFLDKGLENVSFESVSFVLHEGFMDNDIQLACYTDHQIFERYHRFKLKKKAGNKESLSIKDLNKLHPGDYVVHIDHGIGKFSGLVKMQVNGKVQEVIKLEYRDKDSLFVSIHSLHRITKYKGKEGEPPKINKLGTAAWNKMKEKTKSKVKDIAKDLIALYAKRREEKGFAFSPDSYLQRELEASFIYEDTPDQEKATTAIKEDMEKIMPMDRLVCGDVGFGKTEVAIRAAFKAVCDSKQVAVLVPTTILAFQHFKTFANRLKELPAKVEYISRLRKASEVTRIKKELKEGKIDILIGTHRLVGKDLEFKDLGLLIIDEEQKFGVSVKEKLKQLKINIDTLTLTATPIPRTLQFSMMGARDLSIINTPPPNRYPIVTEVHGFNEELIREAIQYELARGGQVFFIHNRVQNIYEVENMIKRAVPGCRTIVGHGQMDGPKLEKVMLNFIDGEYDVLIATTIIESGLDIPNANTIIINNGQNFGLSELHQLRGRVGRSNKKAFCYLLAPQLNSLSAEARRRLRAIEEFSDLGSGFNIAMQDLDIRGAGNMLGAEQSGFIADIGFETYHRILNEAIMELKQNEYKTLFEDKEDHAEATQTFLNVKFVNDCQIDTDMELLFPDEYISNITERMQLYRELDNIQEEEKLIEFEKALIDRFGALPSKTQQLLEVVRLRWNAIDLGMERIILKNQKMICHFIADQQSPFFKSPMFSSILQYVIKHPDKCKMKEGKDKLTLAFQKVKSISGARKRLVDMLPDEA